MTFSYRLFCDLLSLIEISWMFSFKIPFQDTDKVKKKRIGKWILWMFYEGSYIRLFGRYRHIHKAFVPRKGWERGNSLYSFVHYEKESEEWTWMVLSSAAWKICERLWRKWHLDGPGEEAKIKGLVKAGLRRRNFIVVNGCPMCLRNEENASHLLIHCSVANKVCASIIHMFDMNWVMPFLLRRFLSNGGIGASLFVPKFCGIYLFMLVCGKIWLERNNRVFINKSKSVAEI